MSNVEHSESPNEVASSETIRKIHVMVLADENTPDRANHRHTSSSVVRKLTSSKAKHKSEDWVPACKSTLKKSEMTLSVNKVMTIIYWHAV